MGVPYKHPDGGMGSLASNLVQHSSWSETLGSGARNWPSLPRLVLHAGRPSDPQYP
jgi:hypothetical protein